MNRHDTECINSHDDPTGCAGELIEHEALSGSGLIYIHCERHLAIYSERMHRVNADIAERYPAHPPADWSPLDAGEHWDETDY